MKAFKITIIILFLGFITFHQACDVVEEPFLVPTDTIQVGGEDTINPNIRKVLLEDYTGHKCPNCPNAADKAHTLKLAYGDSLVLLAVHAGFFSEPASTGPFTYDFRTIFGNELNNFFGMQSYPTGMINRTEYGGSVKLDVDSWEAAVLEEVRKPQQARMIIESNWIASSRKVELNVKTEFLEDLAGTYYIVANITESLIVKPQLSNELGVIEDYEHNHVLRNSFNGTWGTVVGIDGSGNSGVVYENNLSADVDVEWIVDNCHITLYIYELDSKEIIQAEEVPVIME